MKKIFLFLIGIFLLASAGALRAADIGVPSECEDVMLQVFYWDSYGVQDQPAPKYGRTKWVDLLKDTAAINANFDLVWFPPSAFATDGNGRGGVGYSPKQYSDQDSDWGTERKLKELMAALHAGKTKVLADVVINHRGTANIWCSFFTDNFGQYGTWTLKQTHICRDDEGFSDPGSSCYNAKPSERGAYDTGTNFEGARDLDHTNDTVQRWAKAYTQWLLNTMQYDGFRYDMTSGYHGSYLSMYNEVSQPYLSVSELWDGINRVKQHLEEANYNTMVFDFPMKFKLNDAFRENALGQLKKPSNSLRGQGLAKYAVTFIDNHDTFERETQQGDEFIGYMADLSSVMNKNKILQANAYILMMPGVPCVFYPHWSSYKDEINALIAVRKQVGIHSESEVTDESGQGAKYEATIKGHRGTAILRLGNSRSRTAPEGYETVLDGGLFAAYTIFVKMNPQGIDEAKSQKLTANSQKFLKDGKLFIRHGANVYDILGNKIE